MAFCLNVPKARGDNHNTGTFLQRSGVCQTQISVEKVTLARAHMWSTKQSYYSSRLPAVKPLKIHELRRILVTWWSLWLDRGYLEEDMLLEETQNDR